MIEETPAASREAPSWRDPLVWRPARVVLYWVLAMLTYLVVWYTLGPDSVKALFYYFAPKPGGT